jgi:tRNA pseudouridine55 synthase
MYKRARHAAQGGKPIDDVPIRNMHVYAVQFRSLQYITIAGETFPVISVTFSVAAGTYIRSLAVAVGERLGCPATLYGLRRTQIGEFSLEQAASLAAYKRKT